MIVPHIGTREALEQFGARLVEECKNAILTKDLTGYGPSVATHNLVNSIRYEVTDNSLTIYALGYEAFLQKGRKPGGAPPISAILQWIDAKGIVSYDGISRESLAFLIARAIARNGTTIYQKYGGNDSGLFADVINTNLLIEIEEALKFAYLTMVKSMFLNGVPSKMRA